MLWLPYMTERQWLLKAALENLIQGFDVSNEVSRDPVSKALSYSNPKDQEVAALISAVFSYGNVRQIQATQEKIFALLGKHPAEILKSSTARDWKQRIPSSFKHR